MLEGLIEQCKGQKEVFGWAKTILIEENQYQHSDFIVVLWLLDLLVKQQKITFITFRQNYAHFLSLSKKLGKSIEGYLKNKQLTYIECFESDYCSQLPLMESTPQSYVSPPSAVKKIYAKDLMNDESIIPENQIIIIDSISFIDERIDLCFWIYEQSMRKNNRIILGGCLDKSQISKIFSMQSELTIQLQNDVGGYGKLAVKSKNNESHVLWKMVNCRLQFSQHISI